MGHVETAVLGMMALACVGCSGSSTAPPGEQAGGEVSGIRVTSPAGPQQVAVWGNPMTPDIGGGSSGGGIPAPPSGVALTNPYPNPTATTSTFSFAMPFPGRILLWIEQVGPAGWLGSNATSMFGASVPSGSGRIVATLADRLVQAGGYTLTWTVPADRGLAPSGYYRIHLRTWRARQGGGFDFETLQSRDIIVYRSLGDLPEDLRAIVAQW